MDYKELIKGAYDLHVHSAPDAKLTAEKKTLNQRYHALKEEVKEAEQIRKSVYSIYK